MLRHVLFLLFLYGVKHCGGNTGGEALEQTIDSKDNSQNGMKKNEIGANGLEANWERLLPNFRNPVLEYLLHTNSDRAAPPKRGVLREIRHSQTLVIPNFPRSPPPELFLNQLPQFESMKKPGEEPTRNPDKSPIDNFWNFIKNKTQTGTNKTFESIVTSPVLHLNKDVEDAKENTRIQTYPAVAVVINTFDKNGSLKKSVTHFQPDFGLLSNDRGDRLDDRSGHFYIEFPIKAVHFHHYATVATTNKNEYKINDSNNAVRNFVREQQSGFRGGNSRQGLTWPFANYFPIVINDPFLSVYNAFATSMYNAVSSMVEYGPEADICRNDHNSDKTNLDSSKPAKQTSSPLRYVSEPEEDIFGEVTMRSENLKRTKAASEPMKKTEGRQKRETTSIFVKSREGDTIGITMEEPTDVNTGKVSEGSDLILRKGGIAIAGPGGAATAYTGGTAIVGPYGTVYKSPEGTAILGPYSKVVDITDDTSFDEILKMHSEFQAQKHYPSVTPNQMTENGFKNYRNFFSYSTNLPIKFEMKPKGRSFVKPRPKIVRLREEGVMKAIQEIKNTEFRRVAEDIPYEQQEAKDNQTTLVFRPKSKAEAGRNGVAVSAPTSHAILYPGQKAHIYFEPESVASAGPSGFAHAHSDLFVTYVRNDTALVRRRRNPRSVAGKN